MKLLLTLAMSSLLPLSVRSTDAQNDHPKTKGPGKQQRHPGDLRLPDRLKVGLPAPDFTLKMKDGTGEVRLSSFQGKRPVVLVFGSYT